MKCPRCGQPNDESTLRCSCGFPFDGVTAVELDHWFDEVKGILETAYTATPIPWQQSGKSGTFEEWTRLRVPNLAAVNRPGKYLDIGCANGFLLECLLAWSKLKELEIIPYGLDYSKKLVELARKRLPDYANNIYLGNAYDWRPPGRFDYVRTELDYVPRNYRQSYIRRLLREFLVEDGKLIISQYRSRKDDLTKYWIDDDLSKWGFEIKESYSGYSGNGLELCRIAVLWI